MPFLLTVKSCYSLPKTSNIDSRHLLEGKFPCFHEEGRLEWYQWLLAILNEDYQWLKTSTPKGWCLDFQIVWLPMKMVPLRMSWQSNEDMEQSSSAVWSVFLWEKRACLLSVLLNAHRKSHRITKQGDFKPDRSPYQKPRHLVYSLQDCKDTPAA